MATEKRHLNQEREGLQSTKISTLFQSSLDDAKRRVATPKEKVSRTTSLSDVITQDVGDNTFPLSDTPNI